jgi:hypothetical protein
MRFTDALNQVSIPPCVLLAQLMRICSANENEILLPVIMLSGGTGLMGIAR